VAIIDEVLADLGAEGDDLDRLVSGIGEDQWRLATPAPGWTIAHQIGHLASSDRLATLAATDAQAFALRRAELADDFDAAVTAGAAELLAEAPGQLLSRWREARSGLRDALGAVPAGERVPWIVEPMSPASLATTRLMELFGHGQDVRDTLGVERPDTDRIVHVARLGVRTRDFAYLARGLTLRPGSSGSSSPRPAGGPRCGDPRTLPRASAARCWISACWSPSGAIATT
jgi:uncharacterized protein (TIGR03084 family)